MLATVEISQIKKVVRLDSEGKQVWVRVETIHTARTRMLTLRTDGVTLLGTSDYPVKLTGGDFRQVGDLIPGAFVDALEAVSAVPE